MLNRKITDAGRSQAGFGQENNDCTVRALAKAGNIDYKLAHEIMAEEGRKPNCTSNMMCGLLNARDKNLLKYEHVQLAKHERMFQYAIGFFGPTGECLKFNKMVGPNINQFVQQHPRGRYIVRIKRHVFAVIDGVIYDRYKQHAGALVLAAYKIIL
jgi:hypothetical protein